MVNKLCTYLHPTHIDTQTRTNTHVHGNSYKAKSASNPKHFYSNEIYSVVKQYGETILIH